MQAHRISLESQAEPGRQPSVRPMANPAWPAPEGRLMKGAVHTRYVEKYGKMLRSLYLLREDGG